MFAKLFETKIGQILLKVEASEDNGNPEVKFYFEPEELGVCSMSFTQRDDSDSSWDAAYDFFNSIDEDIAYKTVKKVIDETMTPLS
jgi:hypothetical protein